MAIPAHRPTSRARPPVETVPVLALAAAGLGAAAVLVLWWHDTGSVQGAADWITGAGRITGLLAGYLTPLLLLLMARIPLLERYVGADRLARWHASAGRYLVCLVTVHALTIIWGYSITAHKSLTSETVDIVWDYPSMIKGTAAGLLFLGTGIVSARAARRRLSYETWYYLHLATYLAIALSFSHQIEDGADLSEQPYGTLWGLYYAAAFAILAWFRLIQPYVRDRRHQLRVHEVRPEGPGVVSVILRGRRLDELRARPGQFFRLQFQAKGLRWAANPYSLSAPPHPEFLRFTVKDLGGHSAAVTSLKAGTKVRAEGPYGAFTADRVRARKILLIAGGVGITPVRSLFESLPAAPGDLTLLYRASSAEDVLFRPELEQIAAARGARLKFLVGRRTQIPDPFTAGSLVKLVPRLSQHDVFLCGPQAMTESAVTALRRAGVPRHRIHHESFVF